MMDGGKHEWPSIMVYCCAITSGGCAANVEEATRRLDSTMAAAKHHASKYEATNQQCHGVFKTYTNVVFPLN